MHPALAGAGPEKAREGDPTVRRQLVEALLLLARSSAARAHLREARAYYVLRAFHWWLEGVDEDEAEAEGAGGDVMVASAVPGAGASAGLSEEDEATVDAINLLVQQLFREDEVPLPPPTARAAPQAGAPSELGGAVVEPALGRARAAAPDETATEDAARRADEAAIKAALAAPLPLPVGKAFAPGGGPPNPGARAMRYATVPLEKARQVARRIANNSAEDEEDVLGLATINPVSESFNTVQGAGLGDVE